MQFKPFQIRWREPLGRPECPYMVRWVVNLWLFSVRVHQWIRSDDKRYLHDHAWNFLVIVLRGGYTDVSETDNSLASRFSATVLKRDKLGPGSVRYRKATHRHYVEVPPSGALTLLLCGMPRRHWGFWVNGVFKRPLKYFHRYGHPPCDEP